MIVTFAVLKHKFTSVNDTVYAPAIKFIAVAVVCPSLHKYVYGVTPPTPDTVALPLFPPKQFTFVLPLIVAVGLPRLFTAIHIFELHRFASVTVTQ